MSTGEAHSTLRDGRGFYVVIHAESHPAEAARGDGFPRRAFLDAFVAVQGIPFPLYLFQRPQHFTQRNDGNPTRDDDAADRPRIFSCSWIASADGTITLRYRSKLRHIAVGRAHKYEAVRLFIADDHVRVISEDGALIRELRIDPSRDYQSLELSAMS